MYINFSNKNEMIYGNGNFLPGVCQSSREYIQRIWQAHTLGQIIQGPGGCDLWTNSPSSQWESENPERGGHDG